MKNKNKNVMTFINKYVVKINALKTSPSLQLEFENKALSILNTPKELLELWFMTKLKKTKEIHLEKKRKLSQIIIYINGKFVKYFTINVIYIPKNGFKLDKIILNLFTNPLLIKEGNY